MTKCQKDIGLDFSDKKAIIDLKNTKTIYKKN
jgi:hypothetical protein